MVPVKLYVYDLSQGMARNMSRQLTGTQIDGIWHTSIIVFGKEISYGQGIDISRPGYTHHGHPLEVHDLGETEIDEATFNEYLAELRGVYTAEKYHLLDFNCNSFSNDVAGFLTGRSIPAHITDLPAHVMSTPFGQSLRPMIDNMYRRQGAGPIPSAAGPSNWDYPTPSPTPPSGFGGAANSQLASSLLQNVATQAAGGSSPYPAGQRGPAPTSPLHVSTNVTSLNTILSRHRATAVLIASDNTLEQAFEQIAKSNAARGDGLAAFVRVDTNVMGAKDIREKFGVDSLPTVLFFRGDRKVSQFDSFAVGTMRDRVSALVDEAFPNHPHASLPLQTLRAVSLDPILYTQVPSSFDAPVQKLIEFIDSAALKSPISESPSTPTLDQAKTILRSSFIPFLKRRFPNPKSGTGPSPIAVNVTADNVLKWTSMSKTLLEYLAPSDLFPVVDLWRIMILDSTVYKKVGESVVRLIEERVSSIISGAASPADVPRAVFLTTLRLAANTFAHSTSSTLSSTSTSTTVSILVAGLLHPDVGVRTAAASLAFNVSARRSAPFAKGTSSATYDWIEAERRLKGNGDGESEKDVEIVVALLEAIEREESEDVVHRLVASLGLLLHLSPTLLPESKNDPDSEVRGMLDVLTAKAKLLAKLEKGGCGPNGIAKDDVKKLVREVASLCP